MASNYVTIQRLRVARSKEECVMYYGFDIGGTKIALGVFDKDLKLQWETRVPTPRDSYDEF